ncbi:MAG: tail fiber domain-containing protein [Faecalibacterium sp.]|nr:tail fiber domain-containing protein [Ruminococcus sp.]MCM1392256.1 tail fiber domain-containing protein [Ruminococcus sp.]MCM1485956.1 tail fiber domain-containing protein [Faecalibacterium sp.]
MITTNIDGKTLISGDAIAGESRTFEAKLRFGSAEYDGLLSFSYTSYISPQKCTLGCTPSAIFKCEAVDLTSSASSLKNQVFKVFISIAGMNDYICLGEFKITESTLKDGIYSITAYDKMNFIKDKLYVPTISGQQLISSVFKDICTQIEDDAVKDGFTKTNPVVFADTTKINPSVLSGYSLKDALSYLCAYAGRNCIVNRNGAFEARKYTDYSDYELLNDDRIETPELDEFDSQIQSLTALLDDENMLSAGTASAQGMTFVCPIMIQSRLNDLYNKDFGLASSSVHLFRAGNINQLLGDPRLEVGDVIPLTLEGKTYNIPIMSLKMQYDGGLMNEIEVFDFGDDEGVSLEQKIDITLKKSKDISKYAQASSDLSGVIAGGFGLYRTEIADESGAIRTYMHDKPQLEDSVYIATFNSKGFAWTANGWNNGSPVWSDGVDTTASSMVMKAISAHKITADMINVTDLSALNATIGGWKIGKVDGYDALYTETTDGYKVGIKGSDHSGHVAFYVKDSAGTDLFYVKNNGTLYAKKAIIEGEITATSLTLGKGVKVPYDNVSGTPDLTVYVKKDGTIGTVKDGSTGIKISSDGLLQASNAVVYGTIYASQGNIGRWIIDANGIKSTSSSNYTVEICNYNNTADDSRIFRCYDSTGTDIFRIRRNGKIEAKNADIAGTITATSGKIAGWNIGNSTCFPSDTLIYTTTADGHEIGIKGSTGNTHIAFYVKDKNKNDVFYVNNSGKLYAQNADIAGTITACGGTIGGFEIKETYLRTAEGTWGTDGAIIICPAGTTGKKKIAGSANIDGWTFVSGSKFGVTKDGALYASGAVLGGSILDAAVINGLTISDNIDTYGTHRFYYKSEFHQGINCGSVTMTSGSKLDGFHLGIAAAPTYLWGSSVKFSSGATVTSDERLKNTIADFTEKHEILFENLQPKTFKYNDGTSDRFHFGFIAQQLKTAIEISGLTTQEVAAYVATECEYDGKPDYTLSIRYSELVSLNTHMIQKCLKEIAVLKAEISLLKSERT